MLPIKVKTRKFPTGKVLVLASDGSWVVSKKGMFPFVLGEVLAMTSQFLTDVHVKKALHFPAPSHF